MDHTTVKSPKKHEIRILRAMIIIGVINMAYFFIWFIQPDHISYLPLYVIIVLVLLFQFLRILHEWYHYFNIKMPANVPMPPGYRPTVDVFTTYFPGEPYEMTEQTLEAILSIRYPHETWLCDEANDQRLKEFCASRGIHHVTRNSRKDAKAGNINNALQYASGEICVIIDPDHVPHPDFLDPIVPHFANTEIGYVQIVQAYYNFDESFVAKGAAQQTFQFYGPMMMSMNHYGTVLAIGANCTFRREALDSIGGHAPGLAEDMHTSMLLHAKGWKSVYVPKILARGQVPSTLHAYFMQQLKWSRGTWDLLVHVLPKIFTDLSWRQRLHYLTAPFYYFSGIIYFLNFLIPIICLVFAILPWKGDFFTFALLILPLFASTVLIRHYVQRWVMEEKERGFHLLGGILQIGTWWVHSLGILYTFIGKKVPYLPTPKDNRDQSHWTLLLPNILVGLFSVAAIIYGLRYDWNPYSIIMAGIALTNFTSMSIVTYIGINSRRMQHSAGRITPMSVFLWTKRQFWYLRHFLYRGLRLGGLMILLLLTLGMFVAQRNDKQAFQDPPKAQQHTGRLITGEFSPYGDRGLSATGPSDLASGIVSFYSSWTDSLPNKEYFASIYNTGRIPMVTWEPWISDSKEDLHSISVFSLINQGEFDEYLTESAKYFAALERPVLIRFAHEVDNPFYPWSEEGSVSPQNFKNAFRRVVSVFRNQGARNVTWVYNPWKASALDQYYPGDDVVDWIGVTLLDYGPHLQNRSYSFNELYAPFHERLIAYPGKHVILAEMGTLSEDRSKWLSNAFSSIYERYPEISALIFFQSDKDQNIPPGVSDVEFLNWSINNTSQVSALLSDKFDVQQWSNQLINTRKPNGAFKKQPMDVSGITYNKAHQWFRNVHSLNRRVLEEDFAQIRSLGFTEIKRQGPGMYDQNVLSVAQDMNMKVHYAFWLEPDSIYIQEQELDIMDRVRELKNDRSIASWNLTGAVFNQIDLLYDPVERVIQADWWARRVNEMAGRLHSLDPERPVTIDYKLGVSGVHEFLQIAGMIPEIDQWVLYPADSLVLTVVSDSLNKWKVPYYWEGPAPEIFCDYNGFMPWQDRYQRELVVFDGLVDIWGRRKQNYLKVDQCLNGNRVDVDIPAWNFILPAIPAWPQSSFPLQAIQYRNGEPEALTDSGPWTIDWYLVQVDVFGNEKAIMPVGKGPSVQLELPWNADYFKVLMVIHNTSISKHITKPLVLPVHPSQRDQYTSLK
ncbi:glycosyltransferase family 2 protein [Fulvivirga sedimenti]|uniref:Glycosyltransferase n=1 Tax=Fulvivirga sedimenti TaxID=2879465 RepID=A0A9X1HPF0_9BACT|nr:glycosyltransferase [Fulvivirga sedimenti]MCA6075546.1 glycosyltransferase [Fulvivirga sedimenti]MCA6076723.1 glycosyltransferase [Fulvivirga sedimenti]MCA6077851.1 glycosyltransferase [Fulvivirga sedimenti]